MAFTPLRTRPVFQPLIETADALKASRSLKTEAVVRDFYSKVSSLSFAQNKQEDIFNFVDKITNNNLLTPEEANLEFGIDGVLEFQSPVTKEEARTRQLGIVRRQDLDNFLSRESQTENLGEKIGNLFLGLGVAVADPVNLIPFTLAAKLAGITKLVKAGSIGQKVLKSQVATSAIDAGLGNLVVAPLMMENFKRQGLEYGFDDMAFDVGLGFDNA